jgi:hypothetical protein
MTSRQVYAVRGLILCKREPSGADRISQSGCRQDKPIRMQHGGATSLIGLGGRVLGDGETFFRNNFSLNLLLEIELYSRLI